MSTRSARSVDFLPRARESTSGDLMRPCLRTTPRRSLLSNAREDARIFNMQQIGLSNKAAADEKAERARREKQLAIAEERRLLEQAQAASKSPW